VPCGIPQVEMTSVARETNAAHAMAEVEAAVTEAFGDVFGLEPESWHPYHIVEEADPRPTR